jgi:hypothetical protein
MLGDCNLYFSMHMFFVEVRPWILMVCNIYHVWCLIIKQIRHEKGGSHFSHHK